MLLSVVLVACASAASAAIGAPRAEQSITNSPTHGVGPHANGWSLNGWSLNGWSLNGWSLNGWSLNGASMQGQTAVNVSDRRANSPSGTNWSSISLENVQVRLPKGR